jgi:CheY-like chemotaxis protein
MAGERAIILLVEDDLNDALLAQKALLKAGTDREIVHVQDGEEAINYLSGKPPFSDRDKYPLPKLVLLDLKMPKLGGFDVLSWLQTREDLADMPVVILTGSIEPRDMESAKKLGAVGYEVKPIDFGKLVEIAQGLDARWLGASARAPGLTN